ncbi:MAG TPA: alpha/beta fold hydrolase, partial [Urbifossiella sp.]
MSDPSPPPPPPLTRAQRFRRFVIRRLWAYPLIYIGVVLVFLALERSLVFHPSSPAESWFEPVDARTQDVFFTDANGTKLHGWWLPPADPADGAVLVAHGNGGNVTHRGSLAAGLRHTLGAGVLLFDYPGYGKSEGKPTEESCYASGEAAYSWLMNEAHIPSNRILLLGESLGGGVAVELATRREHRALVLIYTFSSLPDAAKFHYPWLPTKWLMRTRFDNLAKIG